MKGGNTFDKDTRKVKVHVMHGGIPEKCLMVRCLQKDGVDDLAKSFRDLGIQHPMEIVGVVWVDAKDVQKFIDNFPVDLQVTVSPKHINIVCGLHRTTGLQVNHKLFPKKEIYKYLYLTLLVCPKTVQHINNLLWLGNSDNKKSNILVKTTQWSVVEQYRRQIEVIREEKSYSPAQASAAFTAYKQLTAPQIPFEPNTLHTFSAVASVDDKVFALMEKIFNGEFVVNKDLKGQKKPDAVTHFTSMSGIPPHLLCKWMQRVLDGETLTKDFQKRCKIYSKQERVKEQLLDYMQTVRNQYQFTSLADVIKVYPAVGDYAWFDAVVSSCQDAVKAGFSSHARKMVDEMIATKEFLDRAHKVCFFHGVFVCVHFSHRFFNVLLMSNH